jgi:crotonobetainyl-CoA:carnitine CoA-transferase CaiB-like acyl-CoA transferase
VRTVGEAIRSPEARERALVTRIPHPAVGWVPNVSLPIRFSGTPMADPVAAPSVGQDTEEVLREVLGYEDARLAELSAKGIFGTPVDRHEAAEVPA